MFHDSKAPFALPDLPYALDALEPHISRETLDVHHGKHHRAYVDKLNDLIDESDLSDVSLSQLVITTAGKWERAAIFNNAAQHWNHSFFWISLAPPDRRAPIPADFSGRIDGAFGSFDAFKDEFVATGVSQFGSGWVWLVEDEGQLAIMKTHDADTPIAHGKTPLLTCDVWEHAYYLDYQNRRADFLRVFVDHLADWNAAHSRMSSVAETETAPPLKRAAAR